MENNNLFKKILKAKKEINAITKDSKNPFFKSNYFDINSLLKEVEPVLQKYDLLLLQPIQAEWVKSEIIDIETGEKVSSEMHLPSITDPQKIGSAVTYYRRYTLQSLLGLQAEDDDGNNAKPIKPKQQVKPVELEPITKADIDKLKLPANIKHIDWYLKNRKVTEDQRKELLKIKG